MLVILENIFNDDAVDNLRRQVTEATWIDGRATAGAIAGQVKANLQLDDSDPGTKKLSELVSSQLMSTPQFISAALPELIYPPKFNCYRDGGHYGVHVDGSIMTHPDTGQSLRTDVSGTLFLSPPESYEGGELCIETEFGAQEVKLNAGDLVLYPSTSLHQVLPVTSGERVCAFFWIQSLVRSAEQRAMLYDMDSSIQRLSLLGAPAEQERTVLTGIYHNLLRQWAK